MTGFAPFELNGKYLLRMVTGIPISDIPGVKQFAVRVLENFELARDHIIESRVFQTHHANAHRRDEHIRRGKEDPITEGDQVYLSTADL